MEVQGSVKDMRQCKDLLTICGSARICQGYVAVQGSVQDMCQCKDV